MPPRQARLGQSPCAQPHHKHGNKDEKPPAKTTPKKPGAEKESEEEI
jgi:hypothetical protein